MERGYVKLWRSIDQNELLDNDNNALVVFTKILTRVNRLTGTLTTGRNKFATTCNMKPTTLYGVLKRLESSSIIRLQSDRNSTTIYICNWQKYQQDNGTNKTETRSKPVTIQEKKEKENKKESNKEKSLAKHDEFLTIYGQLRAFWEERTGRKLSDNKTSRDNLKKLLIEHTPEEIQYAIAGAAYFQGKQYKPQVLSFAALYEKWDNLQGHMQSEKGAKHESNRFE